MTMKQAKKLHRALFLCAVDQPNGSRRLVRRGNYVPFKPWARGAIDGHVARGKLARIVGG